MKNRKLHGKLPSEKMKIKLVKSQTKVCHVLMKKDICTFFVCKYFFLAFENREKKELLKEKQHKRRGAKTYNFCHA